MIVHCKYDRLVSVKDLTPHPKNRNKHPEDQVERLAKILKYQGLRAPIVVSNRSKFIVKGHGTLLAIKKNGWNEAPVVYQDFEDNDQEWLFVQSDNAIASWAELDLKGINADLGELGPFDIDLIGIKDFEIEPPQKELGDEEEVPEVRETDIQLGDLFILGDHRLLCGDSTNAEQVEKLMNGEKADMVFTDPPYGILFDDQSNAEKQKKHTGKISTKFGVIKNDDIDINKFVSAIFSCFDYCNRIFIWGILNSNANVPKGSFIVWDKKLEQQAQVPYGDFDICWSKNVGWKMLRHVWGGFKNKEKGEQRLHPTQKPISLIEDFFTRWGKTNDKVVDLFGGSGSTLIACEKTNRKCFMMELDPQYCQVIIDRWEQYTGKKAVKHG